MDGLKDPSPLVADLEYVGEFWRRFTLMPIRVVHGRLFFVMTSQQNDVMTPVIMMDLDVYFYGPKTNCKFLRLTFTIDRYVECHLS